LCPISLALKFEDATLKADHFVLQPVSLIGLTARKAITIFGRLCEKLITQLLVLSVDLLLPLALGASPGAFRRSWIIGGLGW
jgi:hypothetical protein